MSFVVTQRTREIGIRLALGATRLSTVWLVLRDALVMVTVGIAIALLCVWALGRLIASQLYDIKPTDPATIAVATLILCSATLGASLIPARRVSAGTLPRHCDLSNQPTSSLSPLLLRAIGTR